MAERFLEGLDINLNENTLRLKLGAEEQYEQEEYKNTYPVSCVILDDSLNCEHTWSSLYIHLIEFLLKYNFLPNGCSNFLNTKPNTNGSRISNGLWVVSHYNCATLLNRIRTLIGESEVGFSDVEITYKKKPQSSAPSDAECTSDALDSPSVVEGSGPSRLKLNQVRSRSFTWSEPEWIQIAGHPRRPFSKWCNVLLYVMRYLLKHRLIPEDHECLRSDVDLGRKIIMVNGKRHKVSVHGDAQGIVKRIRTLVKDADNIRLSDVEICYWPPRSDKITGKTVVPTLFPELVQKKTRVRRLKSSATRHRSDVGMDKLSISWRLLDIIKEKINQVLDEVRDKPTCKGIRAKLRQLIYDTELKNEFSQLDPTSLQHLVVLLYSAEPREWRNRRFELKKRKS